MISAIMITSYATNVVSASCIMITLICNGGRDKNGLVSAASSSAVLHACATCTADATRATIMELRIWLRVLNSECAAASWAS